MLQKRRGCSDRGKWVCRWGFSIPAGVGHSSYSAELKAASLAFLHAVREIVQCQWASPPKILAVTDSLSLLVHMRKLKPENNEEEEFLTQLDSLCSHASVELRHVKSHNGVEVNEIADGLAEVGLKAQIQKGETRTAVKPKHLKQLAKKMTEKRIENAVKSVAGWEVGSACADASGGCAEAPPQARREKFQWCLDATRDGAGKRVKMDRFRHRRFQRFANQVAVGVCDTMKSDRRNYNSPSCKLCGSIFSCSWRLVQHCVWSCEGTSWCRVGMRTGLGGNGGGSWGALEGVWKHGGLIERVQDAVEGRNRERACFLDEVENVDFCGNV